MDLPKNILVPIDFGAPSRRACDRAVELARELRAKVTLLHAVDAPSYTLLPETLDELTAAAERTMGVEANRLRPHLAEDALATRVVRGRPWQAVLDAAEKDFDLVVCGTHNRRGLAHLALGSVAERIVRGSAAAVLSVPAHAFESREDAGRRLALELLKHELPAAISVVALGTSAVPIAAVVARELHALLDLWAVEPIVMNGRVVGAMGEDELAWYDPPGCEPTTSRIEAEAGAIGALREDLRWVRGTRAMGEVLDRFVVLVPQWLTSASAIASAVRALAPLGPTGIMVAVPSATASALADVRALVDEVVCLDRCVAADPELTAYRRSAEPSYRKVRRLLAEWRGEESIAPPAVPFPPPTRFAS